MSTEDTNPKITLTLNQLEAFLSEQKQITAESLLNMTYYFNTETTASHSYSMENIDKEKFKEVAFKSSYPQDFKTLKKYL